MVLVKKKAGTYRFSVDNVTKKVSDTHLYTLAGCEIFSILDLKRGYWLVGLVFGDPEQTNFSNDIGLLQFTLMLFCLCNSTVTDERLMEIVLRGLTWDICLVGCIRMK